MNLCRKDIVNDNVVDGATLFVAESFARICRRGSAGILDDCKNHNLGISILVLPFICVVCMLCSHVLFSSLNTSCCNLGLYSICTSG